MCPSQRWTMVPCPRFHPRSVLPPSLPRHFICVTGTRGLTQELPPSPPGTVGAQVCVPEGGPCQFSKSRRGLTGALTQERSFIFRKRKCRFRPGCKAAVLRSGNQPSVLESTTNVCLMLPGSPRTGGNASGMMARGGNVFSEHSVRRMMSSGN